MAFGDFLGRKSSSRRSRESGVYYYSTPSPQYNTANDDRASIYSSATRQGPNSAAFNAASAASAAASRSQSMKLSSNAAAAALNKHNSLNSLKGISAYNAGLATRPQSSSMMKSVNSGRTMSLSNRSFRSPDSPSVQRRTNSFQPGAYNPYISLQRQQQQQQQQKQRTASKNTSRANSLTSHSSYRPNTSIRANSITSNSSRTTTGETTITLVKRQSADGRTRSITKTTVETLPTGDVITTTVIKKNNNTNNRADDLESISEEFDPEFFQEFDNSPAEQDRIENIYEESEEDEYYLNAENDYLTPPSSASNSIPLQQAAAVAAASSPKQQGSLRLSEAVKKEKAKSPIKSPSLVTPLSPKVLKAGFKSDQVPRRLSNDMVEEPYQDSKQVEAEQVSNGVIPEQVQQNYQESEDSSELSQSQIPFENAVTSVNGGGQGHSYRKLTSAVIDKPFSASHEANTSPVRSILKKQNATEPLSNDSSRVASQSSFSRRPVTKANIDYDEDDDLDPNEVEYTDAVEDIDNVIASPQPDSEKVTEEVKSYQSPNLSMQNQAGRFQPHRIRSNSLNSKTSHTSSSLKKSVKISNNLEEIKITPIEPEEPKRPVKQELTEAEMYQMALAAAMKKVYGDRLDENNNVIDPNSPTNQFDEFDTPMDEDTQRNTILNSQQQQPSNGGGRTMSMTSQSTSSRMKLPLKNKDRTMSMTSQSNISNYNGDSQYHYQSNSQGLGFKTHSLRAMPNDKELKKLNKQREKEEAKRKKEFRQSQKEEMKKMAKQRKEASSEHPVEPVAEINESMIQNGFDNGDPYVDTPISAPATDMRQSKKNQVTVDAATATTVAQQAAAQRIEESPRKKKSIFSFGRKKDKGKDKSTSAQSTPAPTPKSSPVVQRTSLSKHSVAPLQAQQKLPQQQQQRHVQSSNLTISNPQPIVSSNPISATSDINPNSNFTNANSPVIMTDIPANNERVSRADTNEPVGSLGGGNSTTNVTMITNNSYNGSPFRRNKGITMHMPDESKDARLQDPPSLISKDSLQIHRDDDFGVGYQQMRAPSSDQQANNSMQAKRGSSNNKVGSKILKLFNL